MSRTLAVGLLGVWLGWLTASWAVATLSFRSVDRVLGAAQRPELAERLAPLAAAERRPLLRHLASEINRGMFRSWGPLQVLLALLALALGRSLEGPGRWLLLAALALTAVQWLGLTGPLEELGRSLDFVPRPLPAAAARRFGWLHAAYLACDLAKAGALALAALAWARRA